MANSYFRFKQFTIKQDLTAMKVGTDGVLLGAWANLEHADRILDIGTGTGLIALMAAQRNEKARIDAVEIEYNAFIQASENIATSPWAERISLHNSSIQEFSQPYGFDAIICNPPFFINSTKNPGTERILARHTDSLTHADLLNGAERLLTGNGTLHIILPVQEAILFINEAQNKSFYASRITRVSPNPEKMPNRYLMEFFKSPQKTVINEIITELERHQYSDAYKALTKDFYLFI